MCGMKSIQAGDMYVKYIYIYRLMICDVKSIQADDM